MIDYKKADMELAFFLRRISVLIESGLSIYDSLKVISNEEGECSKIILKIIEKTESGIAIEEAIRSASKSIKSNKIRMALMQLATTHSMGERGKRIRRLSNELVSRQEYEIKEYSNKSSIYGLIFVVLAVIAPTFLTIIYFLGGISFGVVMNEMEYQLLLLLGIPIMSLGLIIISEKNYPLLIYDQKHNEEYLFLLWIILAFFIFYILGIVGVLLASVFGAYYIYQKYLHEKKRESIEENIPDMLSYVSQMHGMSFEKITNEVSKAGYGELSEEFRKANNQLKSNVGQIKILKNMENNKKSVLFSRTISLFRYSIENNNFKVLSEMAEDIMRYFEIKRNRANSLAIQKYTLILGSILIPIILTITKNMGKTFGGILGTDVDENIFETAIPLYLIIYSMIAGRHITSIEERKSIGLATTIIMVVLGLGFYLIMMNV
ncbi:MAG: type II secretion system F family protein [Candidatus ainarchaeum sp.]|nr:type II secretion system F family protein [Candidatus ainarchaeum sp.]